MNEMSNYYKCYWKSQLQIKEQNRKTDRQTW